MITVLHFMRGGSPQMITIYYIGGEGSEKITKLRAFWRFSAFFWQRWTISIISYLKAPLIEPCTGLRAISNLDKKL